MGWECRRVFEFIYELLHMEMKTKAIDKNMDMPLNPHTEIKVGMF